MGRRPVLDRGQVGVGRQQRIAATHEEEVTGDRPVLGRSHGVGREGRVRPEELQRSVRGDELQVGGRHVGVGATDVGDRRRAVAHPEAGRRRHQAEERRERGVQAGRRHRLGEQFGHTTRRHDRRRRAVRRAPLRLDRVRRVRPARPTGRTRPPSAGARRRRGNRHEGHEPRPEEASAEVRRRSSAAGANLSRSSLGHLASAEVFGFDVGGTQRRGPDAPAPSRPGWPTSSRGDRWPEPSPARRSTGRRPPARWR